MKYRKLTELNKLPNNPRTIEDHDFKILVDSIKKNKKYFEARPLILSNRTGELVIIAGNQRYDAAFYLGMEEVPTFLIEGLTEDEEQEIIIRDNVSNGNWDWEELKSWDKSKLEDWGVVDISKDEQKEETSQKLNDMNELIIDFTNDLDHDIQELFEELQDRGYTCRILTS